jgi:hypothetical protein
VYGHTGEISNLVMSSDEALVATRDKVSMVQAFIGNRKMPRALAKDIVSTFYEKANSNQDTERIFSSLSSSLRVEVAMHISLPLVKSSEIFGACSSGFTTSLCVLMQEIALTGEETIFRAMEGCAELYIVATNNVNVFTKDPEGIDQVTCLLSGSAVERHMKNVACTRRIVLVQLCLFKGDMYRHLWMLSSHI